MKMTKALLAALILTFGLTSCDSMVNNKNEDDKSPVVEEKANESENTEADDDKEVEDTNDEDTEDVDDADDADDVEDSEDSDQADDAEDVNDDMDDTDEEAPADTSGMSTEEKREALEQAIFDNRSQARAAELLLEMAPDKVEDIRPQLEALIEKSNDVLARAQQALDQLN